MSRSKHCARAGLKNTRDNTSISSCTSSDSSNIARRYGNIFDVMTDYATQSPGAQRPAHHRNASSKSNILRSFVSPKSKLVSPEAEMSPASRTKSFPLLPPDHPHTGKTKVLGERQGNMQSPPSSPSKHRVAPRDGGVKIPTKTKDGGASPKKSKSSTNLSAVFARMNRSSKDLSAGAQKDKENETPPPSATGPVPTPIWARYSSSDKKESERPKSSDSRSSNLQEEIARYTPQEYSPSKQRNFDGTLEQPSLRPTLSGRPKSTYEPTTNDFLSALTRSVSGRRSSTQARRSEDAGSRQSKEQSRCVSGERPVLARWKSEDRKASGSSCEQEPAKEKLTIAKRGGRVMAAVAALQGKSKTEHLKQEPELDQKTVDDAFEAVLDSRNIPEPMRQKMRSLTLRVKADFIKQDQGLQTAGGSPTDTVNDRAAAQQALEGTNEGSTLERQPTEEDGKSTKRSRRSRTFTFSKGERRGESSASKKRRSQSKSRPTSMHIPTEDEDAVQASTTSSSKPFTSFGRKTPKPAAPADYIGYLQKHQDLAKLDDERLHKLRLLLRNETVAWVDSFVSLGGMRQIVDLLQRIMAVEWREDHEDKLLHEALLCLKGLCTTERAMAELDQVADDLFPALMQMLFDDEKKGPAEYTTRSIISNVLCKDRSESLCVCLVLTYDSHLPCEPGQCLFSCFGAKGAAYSHVHA